MRFGVCAAPAQWSRVVEAGADYMDCPAVTLNDMSDEQLTDFSQEMMSCAMRCEAMAVLFPGARIPLTGENRCLEEIDTYVRQLFARTKLFAPSVVVFGSGGARRCPEGFDHEQALSQLAEVGRVVAQAAAPYGITIALEPLNRSETNLIHSLSEALALARRVDCPNFQIIADIYHMLLEDEPAEALLACEGWLAHTHIAAKVGRACPQADEHKVFSPYFEALRKIGYNDRMSIEGDISDQAQLTASLALLREWA